jgi:hypothetical protein
MQQKYNILYCQCQHISQQFLKKMAGKDAKRLVSKALKR